MGLGAPVATLMRQVAEAVVMPRFGCLRAVEVAEKSPGEVVTSADLEAELRLSEGLATLLPGARIIGEEAAARDPALLDGIGHGLLWLIDPLDGTANFVSGRQPFGMMVALIDNGETQAAWLLDPASGRMCNAERDRGAWLDGTRLYGCPPVRSRPVAALGTHFLPTARRDRVHAHAAPHMDIRPVPRCAAASYPSLALGAEDIALFQRTLPWDHAAGVLFLTEAGGIATDWHGQPWRVGTDAPGILAATGMAAWQHAAAILLAPEAGLPMQEGACV